jgi:hemolysin III
MSNKTDIFEYYPREEKANILTHAFGFVMSLIALIFLIDHAIDKGETLHLVSFSVFGLSLIVLYAASTIYHYSSTPYWRIKLRIFDHSAIYVLIAGTYTPMALITLKGGVGLLIFGVVWGLALLGIILKLFFTGKYEILSTLMYIGMGWMVVFAIKPLIANFPIEGLWWIFGGGAFYTVGAILYSIQKIPFNHAIFHVCVLGGSFCHFMAIYFHVLPH